MSGNVGVMLQRNNTSSLVVNVAINKIISLATRHVLPINFCYTACDFWANKILFHASHMHAALLDYINYSSHNDAV